MRDRLSDASDRWERDHSNEYDLWAAQPDTATDLIDRADGLRAFDPAVAFTLYREAADAGSAWAMEVVGLYYQRGTAVAPDISQARQYYCRAIDAGSWMATIYYARLLQAHGETDAAMRVLEDGVEDGFIPASFWLALFRYRQSPTRRVCREIRPLLEHAAGQGHPDAEWMLAQLMARGRFGLGNVVAGLRRGMAISSAYQASESSEKPGSPSAQSAPAQALPM